MSGITGYKKNWYKEWFGEEYLKVYEHRDDDDARNLAKLIQSRVAISPDSHILDVACGNGRHAFQFTHLTKHIVGIDLSSVLLKHSKCSYLPPYFIQADMRYLPVAPKFDLVLSLFTSFGYFEEDRTNQEVVIEMGRALKPGGVLVIDYLNPEYVLSSLVPEGKKKNGSLTITERRWISEGRIQKEICVREGDDHKIFYESVKLYTISEMKTFLEKAGIRVSEVFGEYDGQPHHSNSSRMILFGIRSSR